MKKLLVAIFALCLVFSAPAISATTATDNTQPTATETLFPIWTIDHFATGSSQLTPDMYLQLTAMANYLQEHPNSLMLFVGVGNNYELSMVRSYELTKWLVNHGAKPDQLLYVSLMGFVHPMPAAKQGVDVYLLRRQ